MANEKALFNKITHIWTLAWRVCHFPVPNQSNKEKWIIHLRRIFFFISGALSLCSWKTLILTIYDFKICRVV